MASKTPCREWTPGSNVGSVARLTTPWVEMGMNDHATGSDVLFRPALRSLLLLYASCLILEQSRPCCSAVSVPIATFHLPPRLYVQCLSPCSAFGCHMQNTNFPRPIVFFLHMHTAIPKKYLLTGCRSAP